MSSTQNYAHPEVLVDTDWLLEHHKDANVRIAEVDYDPAANYAVGHIPGAVLFDWKKDINDPVRRELLGRGQLDALFGNAGLARTPGSSSTATSTTGSPPSRSGPSGTTGLRN